MIVEMIMLRGTVFSQPEVLVYLTYSKELSTLD